ncbi:MAG: MFS transporter [Alphaproteobacteria bacterium]
MTQFLGAFNDNLYKTSVSVLVAYGLWDVGAWKPEILVSLAAGLFILPFILFAPLAGQLADKYAKDRLIRIIKMFEIGIVLGAALGLWLHSVPVLLVVLFAFGTHSAFFSPCKFSLLPQHLEGHELIAGNGLVNTGTYLAILLGNIVGGLLAVSGVGLAVVYAVLLVCAVAGLAASFFIPLAPAPAPGLLLNFNVAGEAFQSIGFARGQGKGIFTAMLGSAWFFFVGAMVISQLPNYTKQVLGADTVVLTFFMTVFSVGISLGGLVNHRILGGRPEARFVPWAALAMAVFSFDLVFASRIYHEMNFILGEYLIALPDFLSAGSGWRIVFDLFMMSVAAGLYIVPLKAIVQHRAPFDSLARIVAAGALLDSLFILASSVFAIFMLSSGFAIEHLFGALAVGSLGAAFYLPRLNALGVFNKIFRRQYE